MEILKLKELAGEVRVWAEGKQKKYPELFAPNLTGICAKASAELCERLSFPSKIAINDCHAYVVYNELAIDITATQFGIEEKIFIFDFKKPPGHWWEDVKLFNNTV